MPSSPTPTEIHEMRAGLLSLTVLGILAAVPSAAADLGVRETMVRRVDPAAGKSVRVVVDDLFLRSRFCPESPNCVAPRVLPIVGHGAVRERVYTTIAIPVDPRFAHRY